MMNFRIKMKIAKLDRKIRKYNRKQQKAWIEEINQLARECKEIDKAWKKVVKVAF